jgi:hypothetical protein
VANAFMNGSPFAPPQRHALGAYYRRIARRIGGDVAVFATARKLAVLIYHLLGGSSTSMKVRRLSKKRYQEIRRIALKARAKEPGYELVQSAKAPSA